MKTKSLFIAAFVVMSAVVSAVGKDEPSKAGLAVVPVKGTEVFKVIYKSETAGKVRINLYNASSEVVFTESLSGGFIRPLNFKGLAAGTYTLEIVDANGKRTETITYAPAKSTYRISKLAKEEGKFLLSVANPSSSVVTVKIFNRNGDLLHTETNKDVQIDFAKVYKVTNVTGVTFEVSDDNGKVEIVRF
jgi:hypothetical protein